MTGNSEKLKKFLPIVIVLAVLATFFVGFGVVYSVKVPIHDRGLSPQMNIGGQMSIAFVDPSGKRIPIGKAVAGDIMYTYNGHQVKSIAYNVTLIVAGKKGDTIGWHVKVVFIAEKISSKNNGGSTPEAIIPLRITPGNTQNPTSSYNETFGEDSRTMTSSQMKLGGAGLVDITKIVKDLNPQPGDQIKITVWAVANVVDHSNGSKDSATSDSITFTISVGNDPSSDIQIKSITISSNPT